MSTLPRLALASSLLCASLGCEPPLTEPDGGASSDTSSDAGSDDAATVADAGPPPTPVFLRDAQGGAVLLRGTNVEGASKTAADYLPRQRYADFVQLREELGLNAIRLLVFWEAIEPTPGAYDAAYLTALTDIVRQAGDAGLYVVIDMHQDVFGEGFGFTGAPRWACDESLYASFEAPMGNWALAYAEPEVQACFDHFWTDAPTRAAFARAWAQLARALRDEPAVFAYELLNEPSAGSMELRQFESVVAPALYTEVLDAIRAEDARPYVFFGPASAANFGSRTSLVAPARERVVYAPHLYSVSLELGTGYDGNTMAIERQLSVVVRDSIARSLPFAITELGARPDVPRSTDYLRDVFNALDAAQASALQWEIRGGYDLVDDMGRPTEIGRVIGRPFPARTAGTPDGFAWDAATRSFSFEWDEDTEARGETLVMAPRSAFPAGFTATLDDGGAVVMEPTQVRIEARGTHRRLVLRAR